MVVLPTFADRGAFFFFFFFFFFISTRDSIKHHVTAELREQLVPFSSFRSAPSSSSSSSIVLFLRRQSKVSCYQLLMFTQLINPDKLDRMNPATAIRARMAANAVARRGFSTTRVQMSSPYHYAEGPRSNIPFNPLTKYFFFRFWGCMS